ncbi:IS701 family transposase [Streptomyces sp. NBC_00341]|uniref:IS701 family transposase n=1 Tax=Streptomyces sp. NBC_00341 TaxID=2975717 RepID=UPI003085DCA6|nr:IS701 family transposase [Streptomyces sp. NBC_00341]
MAAGHSVDPARWRAMFDQAMARIAGRFRRVEPRATARAFVLGLLSGVERKNCWQLAEQAGHTRPGPMQRLLRSARWDADEVRDEVRSYVLDHLGGDGVLIVDETGFLKKGDRSAGVQRQYTGTAGRIENAQVGVFLAYASAQGRALIDRRLYLPEHTWCQDTERRSGSGVPEDVEFVTKPRLAWQMIEAALDAGCTASWVTGDEVYGQDPQLRSALEARGVGYVLAVACTTRVRINQDRTVVQADTAAAALPPGAWQRQSAGAGAKGPRYYDWAWVQIGPDHNRSLLIRRNPATSELAFYLCWSPGEVALSALVLAAGIRWCIEECFQAAKYIDLDRAASAEGYRWRPPWRLGEPILVEDPDWEGATLNGRRRPWAPCGRVPTSTWPRSSNGAAPSSRRPARSPTHATPRSNASKPRSPS